MTTTSNQTPAANNGLPIAIIGGSYAGLTLANVLHRNSIPYTIFDSKSPPFTYVMGGTKFNVPSYEIIAKKLELETLDKYCEGSPTRKDVIESLLQRVGANNLITSRRIVRIEQRSGHFYLHSIQTAPKSRDYRESTHGPFQSVVGADGVLSMVRKSALKGTYLIGDARWAKDRWYDFGLQRINQGADMALLDGLKLGQALISRQTVSSYSLSSKFCAHNISRRRTIQQLILVMTILTMILFQRQNILHELRDAVFSEDCLNHDRQNPLLTFQFHEKIQQWLNLDGTYAILSPNPYYWIQLTVLISIQSIIAILLAITIYKGIIQRRGSTFAYLLCWGFILPFAVILPFYLISFFDVRNRAVLVSTAATPTLVTFRCLEALYGFSPHSVEDSLFNYCMYYSSVIEFVFDKNTRSPAIATMGDVVKKGKSFMMNLIVVSLLLSFMEVHEYQPFDINESTIQDDSGLLRNTMRYVQPGHVANNFFSAVLTSSTVATGTAAFGFAICGLAGILTLDVFDSPMFKSTSVSDFWGRRWNRLVRRLV